jgi:hypothetical protein
LWLFSELRMVDIDEQQPLPDWTTSLGNAEYVRYAVFQVSYLHVRP